MSDEGRPAGAGGGSSGGAWEVPGGGTPPAGPPGPPPVPPPGYGPPSGFGPPGYGPPAGSVPPPPRKGRTGLVLGLLGGGLLVLVVLSVLAVTLIGTTAEPDEGATVVGPVGPGAATAPEDLGPPGLSDHWHAAFGIQVCGEWLPDLGDVGPSTTGIHTHDDGIIHVHPFTPRAAGDRARMGHFLDAVGLITDDDDVMRSFVPLAPDDRTCAGQPASWALVRFEPDTHGAQPVAVVEDLADVPEVRFEADRQAFVLAFLAPGDLPPPPPSLGYLDRVSPPPG